MSSLLKKYIMAVSGFVLVGFVIGHMLGNLQMFLHPDWINEYAYKLQHLPYGALWLVRLVMLTAVLAHVAMAISLYRDNKRARPQGYQAKAHLQATLASRTMYMSGPILAAFIVFHILHFTIQSVHPEFKELHAELQGTPTLHHVYDKLLPVAQAKGLEAPVVHDVYSMVAIGFSPQFWYVPVFYIIAMGLLALHLRHGISSMFQSLGLRNRVWRQRLGQASLVIALLLFIGFGALPLAGLLEAFPHQEMAQTLHHAAEAHP